MDSNDFQVVKWFFVIMAGITGCFVAWFNLRSAMLKDEERVALKEKYKRRWETIRSSRFLSLPYTIIQGFLEHASIYDTLQRIAALSEKHTGLYVGATIVTILLSGISGFFVLGISGIASVIIGTIIFFFTLFLFISTFDLTSVKSGIRSKNKYLSLVFLLLLLAIYVLVLALVSEDEVFFVLPIVIVTFPLHVLALTFSVATLSVFGLIRNVGQFEYGIVQTISATPISVPLTLMALLIGSYVNSSASLPNVLQFTLSNIVFDGLTVFFTIVLLQKAIDPKSKISIPIAIIIDLVLSALFAMAALYFGALELSSANVGQSISLSIPEAFNVLIGFTPDGKEVEFGPYFWAMHTTFIPTLLYLSVILLCWIGKLVVLPLAKFFWRGSEVEKPNLLTAGVFALLGAVCLLFAGISGVLEEKYKEPTPTTPPASTASTSQNSEHSYTAQFDKWHPLTD